VINRSHTHTHRQRTTPPTPKHTHTTRTTPQALKRTNVGYPSLHNTPNHSPADVSMPISNVNTPLFYLQLLYSELTAETAPPLDRLSSSASLLDPATFLRASHPPSWGTEASAAVLGPARALPRAKGGQDLGMVYI